MNFLRSFLKSSESEVLATIPSGVFYLKRAPTSVKGQSECLFRDAVVTLRKTSEPFNYQLAIQRAYEQGEEELEDDSDDDSESGELNDKVGGRGSGKTEEWEFLLDECLHLTYTSNEEDQVVIVWRDLESNDGDHFEFVCDADTKGSVFDKFDITARRCQYERKFQKPWNTASAQDLEAFEFDLDPVVDLSAKGKAQKTKQEKKKMDPRVKVKPIVKIDGHLVFDTEASLHLFDAESGSFIEQLSNANVSIYDQGNYTYWLEVDDNKNRFLGFIINSEMNPVFNFEHVSFIFNVFSSDGAFSWLLKFAGFDELDKFQEALMKALWETSNKMVWAKIKQDDRDFLADSFGNAKIDEDGDYEFKDADDEFFDAEDDEEYAEKPIKSKASYGDGTADYDDAGYEETAKMQGNGVNKELAVGNVNDRSYVLRDNMLGVFKQTPGDLEFQTTIGNISNLKGKALNPSKILLQGRDTSMIFQDNGEPHSLFKMDLEYGKVVEEWNVSDTHKINAFAPVNKFAPSTDEKTLVGASDTGIFKIDPRLSGTKLVDSQLKNYATKMKFTSMATTGQGNLAVANSKGEIRLYDRLGINAKTHLPAMGDPIIGLDVSADGKWILATCATYLLLIDASQEDGKTGFLRSFGRDSKPRPKRLQISPEHLVQMQLESGEALSFNMAHFNTGVDTKEQSIVSSSGPYVITWSMRKVLQNKGTPYLIKRYNERVTAENFVYGTDKNVIIALEDDVGMVNRRSFRKPTKDSFVNSKRVTPLRRNQVVNSPF